MIQKPQSMNLSPYMDIYNLEMQGAISIFADVCSKPEADFETSGLKIDKRTQSNN
ncbi:hypothetical protein PRVXT_001910 [Proteinivorax tanatarense]|uniref:Uncharacterized protein n=1 Tax=Proteinivorax tanatarense TaxID=1260629 RepID=A0AAU7VIQ9_9FIRM